VGEAVKVAFTTYPPKRGELTRWTAMDQVPCQGESVSFSFTDDPDESRTYTVTHVLWAQDGDDAPRWHAEVTLR